MITLGQVYHTRVGRNVIAVRISARMPEGEGWQGTSVNTGTVLRVRSLCNPDGTPLVNGQAEPPATPEPRAGDQSIDLEETLPPAPEPNSTDDTFGADRGRPARPSGAGSLPAGHRRPGPSSGARPEPRRRNRDQRFRPARRGTFLRPGRRQLRCEDSSGRFNYRNRSPITR